MEGSEEAEKARKAWSVVSFGANTQTRVMVLDDGYQWRKYGQKEVLGRKFPRSYYRCVHKYTQGCKARKQVQRLTTDEDVVVTTYIGVHSHPIHK